MRKPTPDHIAYRYEAAIGGKVASIGGRLLDGAARVIIRQFFAALAAQAAGMERRRHGSVPGYGGCGATRRDVSAPGGMAGAGRPPTSLRPRTSQDVSGRPAPAMTPGAGDAHPTLLTRCSAACAGKTGEAAPFDYLRAESRDEALAALRETGSDARILAGGNRCCRCLNMRLARPRVLVDIMHVPHWQRVEDDGQTLRIGAAVRQSAVERRPDLARRQPLLAAALAWVGHAQTRSRGTLCGSVAHADPSAELPLCCWRCAATIHLGLRATTAGVAGGEILHRDDGHRSGRRRGDRGHLGAVARAGTGYGVPRDRPATWRLRHRRMRRGG